MVEAEVGVSTGATITMAETGETGGQDSAVWWVEKLPVADDFKLDFTVGTRTFPNTFSGAGFCAVLQNSDYANTAMGTTSDGMGYAGIDKSIAVCFDVAGSNKVSVLFIGGGN